MSDMTWEHASEARAALNAIVTDPDHGVAALSSAQTMSNLLKDYLPDAPREKSILVAAAEAGLADTLRDHVAQGMDPNTAIRLTASSFSASTPFTPEACNWVTDELAVALGIMEPGSGKPGGGSSGGTGAAGSESMPTRIAPIPGYAGAPGAPGAAAAPGGFQQPQPANQAPGQGYPQVPAQGQGVPGQAGPQDQPAAQGYRPGYAPGPQLGGFAQPQGQGYPGQPQPQPQPQPYQAQRFPGQPVQPYPGQQQPQPYQPGRYPGQAGFAQPGQPAPYSPGGFGGPPKPGGGKRALLIGGGVIVLVIVIIVAAVFLTNKPSKHNQGVEPLTRILNPVGFSPVGTHCKGAVPLGLAGVSASRFCGTTTANNIVVWAYQFDSYSHYRAGFAHINAVDGFHQSSPNTGCQHAVETADGSTPWFARKNPKYYQLEGTKRVARPGQVLECFVDVATSYPALIWTMPTMHVVFFAWDNGKGDQIPRIINWWTTVNYG